MSEALIRKASEAAYSDNYRNYPTSLDDDTFAVVHNLLKIEKTLEETDFADSQMMMGEGFFTMLSDRFGDAMRVATDRGSDPAVIDLNYREINTIGDLAIVQGSAAMAPYILGLNGAFVAAGGRDNPRIRIFFEILSGN